MRLQPHLALRLHALIVPVTRLVHVRLSAALVCILEAVRKRKGRLYNSEYHIALPACDARMMPAESASNSKMSIEARNAALFCGRLRAYTLSGVEFVAYDDGSKAGRARGSGGGSAQQARMAMCFSKSPSLAGKALASHLMIRMLVQATPTAARRADGDVPPHIEEGSELIDRLRALPLEAGRGSVPLGTSLLKLVPPVWNEQKGVFEAVFVGRANCGSNKNVQLVDTARPDQPALMVGKLRTNEFSVDFSGISAFQAFAAALAVFDVSSVRRRF